MAWWTAMVAGGLELANRVLQRKWGSQTKQESGLRARAEAAAKEKWQALSDLQEATQRGDMGEAQRCLDRVNHWDAELDRLRDQAAAERD